MAAAAAAAAAQCVVESGTQLLARLRAREPLGTLGVPAFAPGLEGGQVAELVGPDAAGKSELLSWALAHCLLPRELPPPPPAAAAASDEARPPLPMPLPGQGAAAVLVDADGRFNLLRLAAHLETLVQQALEDAELDAEHMLAVVQDSLARLYVARPGDRLTATATLQHAWSLLHHDAQIRLLVLDGWADWAVAGGDSSGGGSHEQALQQRAMAAALQRLRSDFPALVVLAARPPRQAGEAMERRWAQDTVTHRFTLGRVPGRGPQVRSISTAADRTLVFHILDDGPHFEH